MTCQDITISAIQTLLGDDTELLATTARPSFTSLEEHVLPPREATQSEYIVAHSLPRDSNTVISVAVRSTRLEVRWKSIRLFGMCNSGTVLGKLNDKPVFDVTLIINAAIGTEREGC